MDARQDVPSGVDESQEAAPPRTRRQLLTAAVAAAGGALAARALGPADPVEAANGSTVRVGQVNSGTATTTIRNTASSSSAVALKGVVTRTGSGSGTAGVFGQSAAQDGRGVVGYASHGGSGTKGVYGRTKDGRGVHGRATGTTGVNYGVYGETMSTNFGRGVQGVAPGSSTGVFGSTVNGHGVYGLASASSGVAIGTHGQANSTSGYGVIGEALASTGSTYGAYGVAHSPNGTGIYGYALATTGNNRGVFGRTDSNAGVAVVGFASSVSGSPGGVLGITSAPSGYGVYGESFSGSGVGYGVRGFASSASGYAGYFTGAVHVQGTLSKTSGTFLIDHPQNPANRTLSHAFVEAPEMLNVYRGNVTLDDRGKATVRLPRYFRALNADFSYQLTAVGAPAPGLHVSREIVQSRFSIAGGTPGQKVCWIVTGVRQDAWAKANPLRVEQRKRRRDRGKYLNPEVFGGSSSDAMHPVTRVKMPRPRRLPRRPRPAA